ncbi:MAG: hypothetical protein KDC84_13470 [Crocinitomicaceae bacterium]|nr:hypothetical protein [Crocinitomicaceae bacterium]
MAKFRRLSLKELNELEKEFIEFLVINGIDADTWVNLKNESPEKSEAIIDQFSEVVFSSIFRKNEFIDFISEKSIQCFHFQNDQAVLVGVKTENSEVNFLESSMEDLKNQEFEVYTMNKNFQKSREEEMFDLINSGARLSDGQLFKKLCLAL